VPPPGLSSAHIRPRCASAEQTERAREIVQRIRDFVKKRDLQMRTENLSHVIDEAVALTRSSVRDKNLTLGVRMDSIDLHVEIDRIQVQQVLFNLLRNGIEAMQDRPRREILVATNRVQGGMVQISVADTGPGLPDQVRKKLFEPFVTTKENGMGVGLSVCRAINAMFMENFGRQVPQYGGCADQRAIRILDRRDRRRHADDLAVPVTTSRCVMLDRLSTPDSPKEDRFFLYPIWREDDRYWLPYHLSRCETKESLGGLVPRQNDAIQILGDDRIVGRLDDGCQPGVLRPIFHCRFHFRLVPFGMFHRNFAPCSANGGFHVSWRAGP
jgi:Histidine kinase-, DNA gyrase B-, and HSP90-like ATPase